MIHTVDKESMHPSPDSNKCSKKHYELSELTYEHTNKQMDGRSKYVSFSRLKLWIDFDWKEWRREDKLLRVQVQGVQEKLCIFTIHWYPSLAYIAVGDLLSSQRNASVQSILLAGNFLYNQ